jgi:hypothetical protein
LILGLILAIFLAGYFGIRVFLERSREADETPNIVIPVQSNKSQAEMAEIIVHTWLDYFNSRKYISAINDMKDIHVYDVSGSDESFAFTALFSVKPKGRPEKSEWKKNTNGQIDGDWIKDITVRFIVVQHNGRYNFDVLFYTAQLQN